MPKSGRERLRQYCDDYCGKQYKLAELLDLHVAHVSQLLSGARRPGLPLAVKIEERTGIPVESWLLSPRGKRKPRAKQATVSVEVL